MRPADGLKTFVAALTAFQRGIVSTLLNACIWTLFYFLLLRTPMPTGWTVATVYKAGLLSSFVGGAMCRVTSARVWPLALGAAVGIVMGASEAYFSDVILSFWRRVEGGLDIPGRYPLRLWLTIVAGWTIAHVAVVMWRRPREVPHKPVEGGQTSGR